MRPLRVVKPTVVTLNNTIGCGGVEPIRILTTKAAHPGNVVTTTPQSLQTATTTIVLPVMSVNNGRQQQAHVVSKAISKANKETVFAE